MRFLRLVISVFALAMVLALFGGMGCSSSGGGGGRGVSSSSGTRYLPDLDAGNTARGEAYAAEGMHFRKPVPDRREFKPWEFYYKHCALNGEESFYSKTSYDCSGPYY